MPLFNVDMPLSAKRTKPLCIIYKPLISLLSKTVAILPGDLLIC